MQSALLTKPAFAGVRVASRTASVRPRGAVRVFAAANRPVWLPGIEVPPHLKGEMAGDSGFDPVRWDGLCPIDNIASSTHCFNT